MWALSSPGFHSLSIFLNHSLLGKSFRSEISVFEILFLEIFLSDGLGCGFLGGPGIELITSLRIQLAHLGSQVVGRHLSSNYSKPADEKTIEDILKRLMQMKRLTLDN